jgi:hypothetical protein
MKIRGSRTTEKRRIVLRYNSERRGFVVVAGPEVSEVRFDDGSVRAIPNEHLKDIRPTLRPRIKAK